MDKSYFLTLLTALVITGVIFAGARYLENRYQISQYLASGANSNDLNNNGEKIATGDNLANDSGLNDLLATQLKKEDLKAGTGEEAKAGETVTVNYVGTLLNGVKFDSSYDRKKPFTFKLGAGQVIKGWDLGVAGMKVGGKRRLTIPPELGYGANQQGPIPANSTLIFEVELLGVESK